MPLWPRRRVDGRQPIDRPGERLESRYHQLTSWSIDRLERLTSKEKGPICNVEPLQAGWLAARPRPANHQCRSLKNRFGATTHPSACRLEASYALADPPASLAQRRPACFGGGTAFTVTRILETLVPATRTLDPVSELLRPAAGKVPFVRVQAKVP